ncbi:MAG: ThuA domain-containing protein [Bacteroidales bacterium]|nr:ThuA domain-containing protein [Bacteroidales bacterium]
MKKVRNSFFIHFFIFILAACGKHGSETIKVMVVAGGHSFDTTEFVEMFQSLQGVDFDTIMQPRANQMISRGEVDQYDVIVFYDMWPGIDTDTREGYVNMLEDGKGIVFLHHSLVSYQHWDGFKEIIGGKYHTEASDVDPSGYSGYRHDITIPVGISDPAHPVTKEMDDFVILDEGYDNIEVNENVTLLLQADHPDCDQKVGWTHQIGNSRIVYLMQGHDRHAYENENFRILLSNAIRYVNDE